MGTLAKTLAISVLAGSASALAGTGNDLLRLHQDAGGQRSASLLYYVAGMMDGERDYKNLYLRFAPPRQGGFFGDIAWDEAHPQPFCIPDGVTYGQAYDVVVAHLHAFPANRHRPDYVLVRSALRTAWPCQLKSAQPNTTN